MKQVRIEQFTARITAVSAPPWVVPVGLLGGAATGVLARVWMRWISDTPEFSWPGTLGIISAFALFGTVQSAAWMARSAQSSRPKLTLVRFAALTLSLGLFGAAGALMFPTVALASLALWRGDWPRWIRMLLVTAAMPMIIYVANNIGHDKGWNPMTVARIALFLIIYTAIILATWPTVTPLADGWHGGRILWAVSLSIPALFLARLIVALVLRN